MVDLTTVRLGVIGLGYVGLPLAVEFGKHLPVIGFDVNSARIAELRAGRDSSLEVDPAELAAILSEHSPRPALMKPQSL